MDFHCFIPKREPSRQRKRYVIEARANLAAETYEKALLNGYVQFSKLKKWLMKSYSVDFIFPDMILLSMYFGMSSRRGTTRWCAPEIAIRLLPHLKEVFEKYPLSDDFAYTPEYEQLYTELTGAILIYFEKYGI